MSVKPIKGVLSREDDSETITNPEFSEVSWSGQYPAPGGWVVSEKSPERIVWDYFPESGKDKREVGDYVFESDEENVPYSEREATAVLERASDDNDVEFELTVNETVTATYSEQPDKVLDIEEWWVDVTADLLESV